MSKYRKFWFFNEEPNLPDDQDDGNCDTVAVGTPLAASATTRDAGLRAFPKSNCHFGLILKVSLSNGFSQCDIGIDSEHGDG